MAPFYAGYIPVNTFQLDQDDVQGNHFDDKKVNVWCVVEKLAV